MDVDRSSARPATVPSAEAVRIALDTVTSNTGARLSDRNRRFLAFVVSETLAGRGHRVKAYTIGVDVFGRGGDFDPGSDPIVRIEATRLRAALAAYYAGSGVTDHVRIILRPGSYVPIFECSSVTAAAVRPGIGGPQAGSPRANASPIIITHRTDPANPSVAAWAELLIEGIVGRLIKAGFRVFFTPPPEREAAMLAIRQLLARPDGAWSVNIAVHGVATGYRYCWSVSDPRNSEIRVCECVDCENDGPPNVARIDALVGATVEIVVATIS